MRRWLFVLAIVWGWACLGPRSASVPSGEVPTAPAGGSAQGEASVPDAGAGPLEAPVSDGGVAADGGVAGAADPGSLPPSEPPPPETNKRLDFRSGDPVVPIRLMEGGTEATFSGRGRIRMRVGGPVEKTIEAPARTWFTVRITHGRPAKLAAFVQLAEVPFADRGALAAEQQTWESRGLKVRAQVLGTVYGIAGKVIDNRRWLLLVDAPLTVDEAKAEQARILRVFATRTQLFEQTLEPSGGVLEVLDAEGSVVAVGEGAVTVEVIEGQFFDVKRVEFGVGYDFHNFEDRTYRGGLQLTPDRNGALAVVNLIALEDLLKGLVPSEIFARAHPEALKAQAVTARGEVLAKIGTKHLADPYLLCSEQHCAVYRGLTGEALSTNAAVEQTRGEALFAADGRLVDSVYSAVCGGYSEDNDAVWGGLPNPSLRGRPDVIGPAKNVPTPAGLPAFLSAPELPAACRLSTLTSPGKFRWEKRISAAELATMTAPLQIGRVLAISVNERGVSGRAKLITLSGDQGATQIRGELNIRRLFGMLNSAMFLVGSEPGPDGLPAVWVFKGGGWGHGVGMCQTGAIGRAEAGQGYREILRHYFNGAEVAPLY